jgi:DNA repair photolyase
MGETRNRRFQGWDKVRIINDLGIEKEAIAPVIISATRRSDIPAWHSDWFMERLKRGHLLSTQFQKQYVSFAKNRVIVLWTKNPQPMLKHLDELDQMGVGYYFTYTLTDYDQEGLEPNLPPLQEKLHTFRQLSERVGKEKVIWRFDPLVLAVNINRDRLIKKVAFVMENLAGYTEKMVFSFFNPSSHKKVKRNMSNSEVAAKEFSVQDKANVAKHIAELANNYDIQVAACAEAMDLSQYGIRQNKCIDDALMRRLFGQDDELISFLDQIDGQKHYGQRKLCGCIPSFDIGNYNTCKNGCVYCYANDSQNAVANNFNRFSVGGEALLIPF